MEISRIAQRCNVGIMSEIMVFSEYRVRLSVYFQIQSISVFLDVNLSVAFKISSRKGMRRTLHMYNNQLIYVNNDVSIVCILSER